MLIHHIYIYLSDLHLVSCVVLPITFQSTSHILCLFSHLTSPTNSTSNPCVASLSWRCIRYHTSHYTLSLPTHALSPHISNNVTIPTVYSRVSPTPPSASSYHPLTFHFQQRYYQQVQQHHHRYTISYWFRRIQAISFTLAPAIAITIISLDATIASVTTTVVLAPSCNTHHTFIHSPVSWSFVT